MAVASQLVVILGFFAASMWLMGCGGGDKKSGGSSGGGGGGGGGGGADAGKTCGDVCAKMMPVECGAETAAKGKCTTDRKNACCSAMLDAMNKNGGTEEELQKKVEDACDTPTGEATKLTCDVPKSLQTSIDFTASSDDSLKAILPTSTNGAGPLATPEKEVALLEKADVFESKRPEAEKEAALLEKAEVLEPKRPEAEKDVSINV